MARRTRRRLLDAYHKGRRTLLSLDESSTGAFSQSPLASLAFLGARFSSFYPISAKIINHPKGWLIILAGVEGLEPSRTVLETGMLPLHHTPMLFSFKVVGHQGLEPRTNRL